MKGNNNIPKFNFEDSLFNYAKENPSGCANRLLVEPHIDWYSYKKIQKEYDPIVADPLKEKEIESYKYIIIFDPQTLEKCTYDEEDIIELKRKFKELIEEREREREREREKKKCETCNCDNDIMELSNEFGGFISEDEEYEFINYNQISFNLIELIKNILKKIGITFDGINSLRRFLHNNSYNETLTNKKLKKIHNDILYSSHLLYFKPNLEDKFYKNFHLLNRALLKKVPSNGIFTKIAEEVSIDTNINIFQKLLPLTAKQVNIYKFYYILNQKLYSRIVPTPIQEERVRLAQNDIIGRIERLIDEYERKVKKNLYIGQINLLNYQRQRQRIPVLKRNHHWVNISPLIENILNEFEIGFITFYKKYYYLNVHPNQAFANFINDVLTDKRLNLIIPGIDNILFRRILILKYVHRFYGQNIYYERVLAYKLKKLTNKVFFNEIQKEALFKKELPDLSVHLTPAEIIEDALTNFRLRYENIRYVLNSLKVHPNEKYTNGLDFIEKNIEKLEVLLNNPYEEFNELDFFNVVSEKGHSNPLIKKYDPSEFENKNKTNKNKTERTIDYIKSVGEFVAIHIISRPPLTSEICNTSINVPPHKKIRIYKVYIGFLCYNKETERYVHFFTRPIEINFLVETVDSFINKLQKEVYVTTAQIDDLRDVLQINTYVYYVGNQDLVRETLRRLLVDTAKKIGYRWLGIESKKIKSKKLKLFTHFTVTFFFTIIKIFTFISFISVVLFVVNIILYPYY